MVALAEEAGVVVGLVAEVVVVVVASVAGVEAGSEVVEGASWSSSDLYRLPVRSVNSVTVGRRV